MSNLEDAIHRLGRVKDSLYTHLGPDGGLSPESECESGFMMVYSNDKPLEEGRIQIRITAGVSSPWLSNSVVINQHVARASEMLDPKLVKRLMGVTVESWKPQRGLVGAQEFVDKVRNGTSIPVKKRCGVPSGSGLATNVPAPALRAPRSGTAAPGPACRMFVFELSRLDL
ncbi:hypothetical protein [Archangium minus]|uniref:hypothetical protein n=1 Tax=Archangium minus TaxID=83450 RepID=UPI0037C10797